MLRAAPPVLGSGRRELPLLSHALARHATGPRAGEHAAHERRATARAAAGERLTDQPADNSSRNRAGGKLRGPSRPIQTCETSLPSKSARLLGPDPIGDATPDLVPDSPEHVESLIVAPGGLRGILEAPVQAAGLL